MITNDNLHEKVTGVSSFWSLMYPDYVKSLSLEEQIIEIKTSSVNWGLNNISFYYVWGWPGPDVNLYNANNYGKNWAFTKEELLNYWKEKNSETIC